MDDQPALLYTRSHEWIDAAGERRRVGISPFAAQQLGDIVYVEMPKAPRDVKAGDEACVIESCKATASVYAPLPGRIVLYNTELETAPDTINRSAEGEGWLFQIEVQGTADEKELLTPAEYEKFCREEA